MHILVVACYTGILIVLARIIAKAGLMVMFGKTTLREDNYRTLRTLSLVGVLFSTLLLVCQAFYEVPLTSTTQPDSLRLLGILFPVVLIASLCVIAQRASAQLAELKNKKATNSQKSANT